VKFTSAFTVFTRENVNKKNVKIVVGRDARISGPMVYNLISTTLTAMGVNIINIGMASTPTTEMAVTNEQADGGIIITASHNPKQWNALKLLDNYGEFLSAKDGEKVLDLADKEDFTYTDVDSLGKEIIRSDYGQFHIKKILNLSLVNIAAIKSRNFKVAIDCVNSVGGVILPQLLEALGVETIFPLYCEPNGNFPHNPEPLPKNLTEISELVVAEKADLGFVVDPDVDRLAIVNEDGSMFGEEYTLVAVADYVLKNKKGNTVSNLSSTRALNDVTVKHGGSYTASAVGEVNVVEKMKEIRAVIGGEGNGGVIYPEIHYGRDALVGIALFLSYLAEKNISCSELRNEYPAYFMSKNRIELTPDIDVDNVLNVVKEKYNTEKINTIDGVKIDFEEEWAHLRKSNTEPIIRIYTESTSQEKADKLAERFVKEIQSII
ncbi:MAG: phosphoglucosamine mutase, partial [Chlorobi bacterium]|nr:phosphoglucosamine mutase [Chlorobiota bacterium]